VWYNNFVRSYVRNGESFADLVGKGVGIPDYAKLVLELRFSPYDSFDALKEDIDQYWGKRHFPDYYHPKE